MWGVGFLAFLLVFPFVVAFGTAVLEKRRVWPYVPAQALEAVGGPFLIGSDGPIKGPFEDDGPVPSTAHISGSNLVASQSGFHSIAVMRDGKGKVYRVRYDFWLSPDYAILAIISGGTLAGIPVANTWFYTRLADGRRLVTINNPAASEADLTGLNQEALVGDTSFDKQLQKHWERMMASGAAAITYSPQDPLSDHRNLMSERIDRLVQLGYAKHTGSDRAGWKYTPKGAAVLATKMVLRGYRRTFIPDRTRHR